MKRAVCVIAAVCLLFAAACAGKAAEISTDIDFDPEKLALFGGEYLASTGGRLEIYRINNKSVKPYWKSDVEWAVSDYDAERNTALLVSSGRMALLDLGEKTLSEITDSVFAKAELNMDLAFRACFAGGGKLVVAKVLRDKEKPVKVGNTVLGWELSENSGVHVYTLEKSGATILSNSVKIAEMGLEIPAANYCVIRIKPADGGQLAVAVETQPPGAPMADRHYFTMGLDGKCSRVGSYLFKDNPGAVLKQVFARGRLYLANPQKVICVDFNNKRMADVPADASGAADVELLAEETGDFAVARFYSGTSTRIVKYALSESGLESAVLSEDEQRRHTFITENGIYWDKLQLSAQAAKEYKLLGNSGIAYRYFGSNVFLADADGKAAVLFK